jgi:hypothetical protein
VIKPKSRFFGHSTKHWQRADANYFTVDGVSANFGVTAYIALVQSAGGALPALSALGGTNSLVSVDAMQEFRIQTSSFAPEFGRTPGGQISIVTRSGTNSLHGTAFDYFRNGVLDANDWFANFNSAPPVVILSRHKFLLTGSLSCPGRTSCLECLLCSMDRNIRAARLSIQRLLPYRPPHSRVISGAMCCGVSEQCKLTGLFQLADLVPCESPEVRWRHHRAESR